MATGWMSNYLILDTSKDVRDEVESMAIIVRGQIPSDEFALHHALRSLPETRFRVERIVESGEEAIMPLLWARGTDWEALEAAVDEDSSVDRVQLLATFDDEFLFRVEWLDQVRILLQMLTSPGATVLDAFGRDERWRLRLLFPERQTFSETHDFCERHGLTFEIESVRELDTEPAGRYGLTTGQYRALVCAAEQGYFSVPRETTLEELADEADVSHQALSERLRRGTEALIKDALVLDEPADLGGGDD